MDTLVARFIDQVKEANDLFSAKSLSPAGEIRTVYIAGMGGSGIGGDFVATLGRPGASVPIVVGKNYEIPAWIDEHTLCICSSYSGNTEETLTAMDAMMTRGAQIVCITSGGRMLELAEEHGHDYLQLPGGWPSPRACLGYSMVAQMYALSGKGVLDTSLTEQIKDATALLTQEVEDIKARAKMIAAALDNKTAVIYSTSSLEPCAVRMRQQINENAKALCWHHVVPEMNHNELVGWKDERPDLVAIFLRTRDDLERNQLRMDICKDILRDLCSGIVEIYAKGRGPVAQSLYLVHLIDWVSVYLADMRSVDSVEIDVIDRLKAELAEA